MAGGSKGATKRARKLNGTEETNERTVKERVEHSLHTVKQHPASTAAVGAVAFYAALRAGIQVFHLSRRFFLRQLLLDLCAALEACHLTYWVDFGSLLGLHRDGDLILHDNDIDLAVLDPKWDSLLPALRRHLPQKYDIKVVSPSECPSIRWVRVYCPLGMADLFGAFDRGGEKIEVDFGHGDYADIHRDLVLPPRSAHFRGIEVRVPRDVESTLVQRYGLDWRTPRYMDKGSDTVEAAKLYARVFKALSVVGIRL